MPMTLQALHWNMSLTPEQTQLLSTVATSQGESFATRDAFMCKYTSPGKLTVSHGASGVGVIGQNDLAVIGSGAEEITLFTLPATGLRVYYVYLKVTLAAVTYAPTFQFVVMVDTTMDMDWYVNNGPQSTEFERWFILTRATFEGDYIIDAVYNAPVYRGSTFFIPQDIPPSFTAQRNPNTLPVGSIYVSRDSAYPMAVKYNQTTSGVYSIPVGGVRKNVKSIVGAQFDTAPDASSHGWTVVGGVPATWPLSSVPTADDLGMRGFKWAGADVNPTNVTYSLSRDKKTLYALVFVATISMNVIYQMQTTGQWTEIAAFTCPKNNAAMARGFQVSDDKKSAYVWCSSSTGAAGLANMLYLVVFSTNTAHVVTFPTTVMAENPRVVSDGATYAYIWANGVGGATNQEFYIVQGTLSVTRKADKPVGLHDFAFMVGNKLVMRPISDTTKMHCYDTVNNTWSDITVDSGGNGVFQCSDATSTDLYVFNTASTPTVPYTWGSSVAVRVVKGSNLPSGTVIRTAYRFRDYDHLAYWVSAKHNTTMVWWQSVYKRTLDSTGASTVTSAGAPMVQGEAYSVGKIENAARYGLFSTTLYSLPYQGNAWSRELGFGVSIVAMGQWPDIYGNAPMDSLIIGEIDL